jgi:hypothetical protein
MNSSELDDKSDIYGPSCQPTTPRPPAHNALSVQRANNGVTSLPAAVPALGQPGQRTLVIRFLINRLGNVLCCRSFGIPVSEGRKSLVISCYSARADLLLPDGFRLIFSRDYEIRIVLFDYLRIAHEHMLGKVFCSSRPISTGLLAPSQRLARPSVSIWPLRRILLVAGRHEAVFQARFQIIRESNHD